MNKNLMTLVASLLVTCLAGTVLAQDAAYKVIVNPANKQITITAHDLQAIYLARKQAWDSGDTITVVALPDDSAAMSAFLKAVVEKSVPQYQAYWREKLFSGKAVPPRTFKTTDEVVAFVVANPGAVAVVEAAADVKGMTAVTVQ